MIESIISLSRRMDIQKYVPSNYCEKTADFLIENKKTVGIVTGFFVNNACETDGPLGAILLGEVLKTLGSEVFLLADKYCMIDNFERVEFPITDHEKSRLFADSILEFFDPSLMIAIERCGFTDNNRYYNMKREDITKYTAKMDYLFTIEHTIGIGDGGNEIGFGNVKPYLQGRYISKTTTTHFVFAGVSNWGVYGLLAYMSLRLGENVLPSPEDQRLVLKELIKQGFVDGFSGKQELKIDGLPLETHNTILETLHTIVNERL
ncbi:MAG: DUF4392 domain-containing protein [Methanomicrobia archaeon]|nr:DUF4392 domain-containing protein [Methanomicrobia archaeon]